MMNSARSIFLWKDNVNAFREIFTVSLYRSNGGPFVM